MTYEALVKKINPTLKRITYRLNGHFAAFNHEDLYQEALLQLWNDFNAGKLNDKTDSYILQGCYFHLKNFLRKNYDKAKLVSFENIFKSEDEEERGFEEIISANDKDSLISDINCKFLVDVIRNNGLTKEEKKIFNFSLEGLTTRQIGKRLGISHVMVIKHKAQIKIKCRKHMDNIVTKE